MNKTAILGDWLHAHERDADGTRVYVPAGDPLPPSRGRQRLHFEADGTFHEGMPGADDRTTGASGTYEFDGTRLVLHRGDPAAPVTYEVAPGREGRSLLLKRP